MRLVAAMIFVDACWILVLAIKTFISHGDVNKHVIYPTLLLIIGGSGLFASLVSMAGANGVQTYRVLLEKVQEENAQKRQQGKVHNINAVKSPFSPPPSSYGI